MTCPKEGVDVSNIHSFFSVQIFSIYGKVGEHKYGI